MSNLDARTLVSDVVSARVSTTPIDTAEWLARECFAVRGNVTRLSSERDENFRLNCADGREFLLKLTNAAEPGDVTDFQTRAMLHVAQADPLLPVPHLVAALDGSFAPIVRTDGEPPRVARLMTYLRGEPLHGAVRSVAQCQSLGAMLARLGTALRGYSHPAERNYLRWDLCHAATLRPLLEHIEERDRRALATRFLDGFEEHALPRLRGFRSQVIHNDFQPSNVLVEASDASLVVGVIDFGDMVCAPLVNDVAVASAYHVATAPEPLDHVSALVAAYHLNVPLASEEVDVLFDLIATRLVLTAVITNWRVTFHPQNRAYILRNAPAAWRGLERLASVNRDTARAILRRACRME